MVGLIERPGTTGNAPLLQFVCSKWHPTGIQTLMGSLLAGTHAGGGGFILQVDCFVTVMVTRLPG